MAAPTGPDGEGLTLKEATTSKIAWGWIALAAIFLAYPLIFHSAFFRDIGVLVLLAAISASAWNIVGGYAGQVSVGHGMFFGLGAYTSTLLFISFDVNPWIGMVAGALVATIFGLLIGWPCFRLRGHYFVIATLVMAEIVYQVFAAWPLVGSATGLSVPIREAGFANFQFHRNKLPYYYIALAMLVGSTALVWWVQRARLGYILQAIRDDEDAVRSLGLSPQRYKLIAMVISAAIVGACGVFYAQYVLFIDPPSVLGIGFSVTIALITIFGGIGTVAGPIIGAAVLVPSRRAYIIATNVSKYLQDSVVVVPCSPEDVESAIGCVRGVGDARPHARGRRCKRGGMRTVTTQQGKERPRT